MLKSHKIPLVDTFIEAKGINKVRQEVEEYLDQFRKIATKGDLEVNRHDMQKYVGGPTKINTMLFLLKKETQIGSVTMYLDAMEAIVYF